MSTAIAAQVFLWWRSRARRPWNLPPTRSRPPCDSDDVPGLSF